MIAPTAPTGPVACQVQGLTTEALAFSILRTIPVLLAAPAVSVAVTAPAVPFVATSVSVGVAPRLVVDGACWVRSA